MPLIDLNGLGYFKDKENAMVAAEYSATKTYKLDEHCYYQGVLKTCIVAITTPEAFTAAHWKNTVIADELTAQSEKINEIKADLIVDSGTDYSLSDLLGLPNNWYIRTNGTIGNNAYDRMIGWIACKPNAIYNVTISPADSYFTIAYAKTTPALEVQLYGVTSGSQTNLTLKTPDDAKFLVVYCLKTAESLTIDEDVYRFATIDELNAEINQRNDGEYYREISNTWTVGYLTNVGTIASQNGYYVSDYIDVKGFARAYIHTYLSANMHICGYDENKNFVKDFGAPSSGGNQNFNVDADLTGVYYVRLTVANIYQSTVYVKGELFDSLDSVYKQLETIDDESDAMLKLSLPLTSDDIHYYISSSSGGRVSYDSFNVYAPSAYTEIEDFKNYQIVFATAPQEFGSAGIAFYDISKKYISGFQYDGTTKAFDVPSKAKYFRYTYFSLKEGSVKLIIKNVVEASFPKAMNPSKYIEDLYATFLTVGVVGDSLASGECYSNNGGSETPHDLTQYSWAQFMARKSGNTYRNFSNGGQNTRVWLTEWLSTAIDGSHDCMAYYIALGQNDHSYPGMGMDYLGEITDIDDSDPDDNADTFYGNYGKIIQKLTAYEPKAIFFLVNMPLYESQPAEAKIAYNEAIANIADHFDNCFLLDLNYYKTLLASGYDYLRAQSRAGHFNAVAYNYFANLIIEATNKVMVENRDAFMQVEFIGTEYSWAT